MKRTVASSWVFGLCAAAIAGCAEDPDFYETEGAAEMNADSITASYPSGLMHPLTPPWRKPGSA
jgi:hypothetical protein